MCIPGSAGWAFDLGGEEKKGRRVERQPEGSWDRSVIDGGFLR